jgi:hypothetical protein
MTTTWKKVFNTKSSTEIGNVSVVNFHHYFETDDNESFFPYLELEVYTRSNTPGKTTLTFNTADSTDIDKLVKALIELSLKVKENEAQTKQIVESADNARLIKNKVK